MVWLNPTEKKEKEKFFKLISEFFVQQAFPLPDNSTMLKQNPDKRH